MVQQVSCYCYPLNKICLCHRNSVKFSCKFSLLKTFERFRLFCFVAIINNSCCHVRHHVIVIRWQQAYQLCFEIVHQIVYVLIQQKQSIVGENIVFSCCCKGYALSESVSLDKHLLVNTFIRLTIPSRFWFRSIRWLWMQLFFITTIRLFFTKQALLTDLRVRI